MQATVRSATRAGSTPAAGPRRRAALVLVSAGALLAAGTGPAAAHSDLTGITPAAETPLTQAPDAVTLTFSEDVQATFTQVAVLDPAGADTTTAPAAVDGAVITQPVTVTTPGAYAVSYRVVSADGHIVDGTSSFTYKPAHPTSGQSTGGQGPSSTARSTSTQAPSTPPGVDTQEAATQQTAGLPAGLLAGIGVVSVLAVAAAIGLARRRSRL